MTLFTDDIIHPIEGWRDILRICTFRMPNPNYRKNLQRCMEGIITALQQTQPGTEITYPLIEEHTPLTALLTLNQAVINAGSKNERLEQYISSLPGINRKTNTPGWRWRTALKRHNKRMQGGEACSAMYHAMVAMKESPGNIAPRRELTDIHATLMTDTFSQLERLPMILRLMLEIPGESHPSGYPAPENLRMVASYLRDEKFRVQREVGKNAPLAASLQQLITRLKNLREQAEQVRPEPLPRQPLLDDSFLQAIALLSLIIAIFTFFFLQGK
ncbi:hypothetical protein FOT62_21500 [Serratia marcescens]|uniref:Uncharacterized protein n=1 Tax=Serratia marcescens TaxID=615 RepID=A0A5C7BVN4_SERMA|nr:hypothetical protein [Serratia marcescens]TXE28343.1 hypothetical protein FOT62_21500 [Serratia marcescens]TXE56849.1 hypothetical protein FOT56_23555 [Serratia marcescens]